MTTLSDFSARGIDGRDVDLGDFAGQVVLVVNTASKCGFTPQYQGLQQLQDTYADRGFTVLGFPCDQFGHQEPGGESEIASFCERNFGVSFPLFAKVDVNGPDAHPLFAWLRERLGPGAGPRWNFHKYLIGPDGSALAAWPSTVEPEAPELTAAVERLLPPGS